MTIESNNENTIFPDRDSDMETSKSDSTKKDTSKKKKRKSSTVSKYKDLEGKLLHIRIGDNSKPATSSDIKDIENRFNNLLEENNINCIAFVTHHAVSIDIIEKQN